MNQHMTGPMWMPTARPDLGRLFAWHPQPVPVFPLLCLAAALLYAFGVIRLHRNGVRWPMTRSLSWLLGLASVVLVTGTGVGGYGMTLFSVHMAQHMVLSMLSPVPLLLGAPLTLALRALPSGKGRRGRLRRLLLKALHSRLARVVSSPLFTVPLFLASLYGLYYTPLFDWGMGGFVGHTLMLMHFLLVGLLLFWPILAVDPTPHTSEPVIRILELFVTAPFHAFFGIAVMSSTTLIAPVFAHPPPAWHLSALTDQHTGGAIAWGFSETPTLLVLLSVAVLWARASDREARRTDRQSDRDGDQALAAYNRWLLGLDQHRRR